ncbi:sterile alpha motif domain-containing protein 9 [Betta splendens]|uniref:Sterile alpha motif domain-containing protein 9 n=1 Tax=Betta splendens TaxID=158456 RepID=A0A6P7L3M5_BETSP|nr:sterile alpha motif domain-containing protein 9 [Betta splendens]
MLNENCRHLVMFLQKVKSGTVGKMLLNNALKPEHINSTDLFTTSVHRMAFAGPQSKRAQSDLQLPSLIDDWTKEHVKDWLTIQLRIPHKVAQNLYDQELSGACLVSFEKQDLLELGVPPAPAIQIMRQVERLKRQSETFVSDCVMTTKSKGKILKSTEFQVSSEKMETETVSSDSGFQSLSSTLEMLQISKTKSVLEQNSVDDTQLYADIKDDATFVQLKNSKCRIRPFDKSNTNIFYIQNHILPPVAGPSNLLEPVHEYKLLPNANETTEREIIYEFTKEVFSFAASCMNSRTNGTIHFGVKELEQGHGEVIGQDLTSFSKYNEAFESCLSEYFEQQYVNPARMCIRPPQFIQVHAPDGTTTNKWVIEVDVVPTHLETQDHIFHTLLSIASNEQKQQCKTECLFVRKGSRSVNLLADSDPRILQEQIKTLTAKVQSLASARKAAEEKDLLKDQPLEGHQGQRLKQLVTRGRDAFEDTLQVIVVTDKCHPTELEHLDFLKEIKLFAVLEFDPESDVNGACRFYREDHVANLHYPRMYTSQDSVTAVIGKLNLFKQTSWIFCNGRVNEECEADKPLTPNEWLKTRSGDVTNMISLLCKPDLLSKDRLLVIFILHSAVTDISNPILETFCAMYRNLEGVDNMLCICKDCDIFSHWKGLIESRCKEDITNKCIFELTMNEISSTIKNLKEPQTQSSRRFLPSTGSSSVLLGRKDEELMTVLDILCENECQNTEIETKDSFQEFKKKVEEDFYRGGQVSWWNFYLSEKDRLPFIKRDKFDELYDLITPVQVHASQCVMINLFHHPGCGGTTLAMHVLWNLRRKFRCAVVKNNMATNNEIATQVMTLLTYGREEQPGYTPVLLLVDNWDDVEDLKQCILACNKKRHNGLMVIILNCERTPLPDHSSRTSRISNVFITNNLSRQEQNLFSEKLQQLRSDHERPETFYAFMIMTNNFSEAYISNLVSNIVKGLDTSSQQGKLLSFLALLNTYVNGSYISLSLCEELVGIRNCLIKQETFDDKMNPFSTLMITFIVEEHGTYQAVRFLHQMIARKCLEFLIQQYRMSLFDITNDVLLCDKLYKSYMGRDFLVQTIHSMLITRQRKELGDDKTTSFSPLIEEINKEGGHRKVKEVLERGIDRFEKSATMSQALARHFCLQEKNFDRAIKWALDAQGKRSDSYMADTVGQVHKSHLKKIIDDSKYATPEELDECLALGFKAVKAFQESQELAKKDQLDEGSQFDLLVRRRNRTYNTSGYSGETEVMMILLEVILNLPVCPAHDRHKRDQMLQFLRGHLPLRSLYDGSNTTINQFVDVLVDHETFLMSLKQRLKESFSFFEHYFQYLKPRSLEREAVEERSKRKVSEYFKKYIEIFSRSEEEKTSEKASKPKLSLHQQIEDQRSYLEFKRADSFAGLLQCLTDKNGTEMENILKKWQFIFENSSYTNGKDTVNFILANIVLHCSKPSSKLLKKYEDLVSLLNEELQKVGLNSKQTELYYLSMLLMWPGQDKRLESIKTYQYIGQYVTSAKRSFHHRFSHMFPARSAIAHFFLGKSSGLKRIVSKVKLDQILMSYSPSRNLHHLWQSGEAWNKPEVERNLLRVKGTSENGDIYINYAGNLKLQVRPVYLGDIRSGYSRENVSFYLGFTMEGPVAYNIKYESDT